jgi:hypothetical protein
VGVAVRVLDRDDDDVVGALLGFETLGTDELVAVVGPALAVGAGLGALVQAASAAKRAQQIASRRARSIS